MLGFSKGNRINSVCVCVCVCVGRERESAGGGERGCCERKRKRLISFKELAHTIVGGGKSEICKATRDPGKS